MNKKILIVYYSHSGHTKRIAQIIQEQTGGILKEIKPVNPYPSDYQKVVDQAEEEIRRGFLPEIQEFDEDLSEYDAVFIGTPNWWSTMAPPVASFLAKYPLKGKEAGVFCTHGGGGPAHILRDVKKYCAESTMYPGCAIYEDGGTQASARISEWLKGFMNPKEEQI